MLPKGLDRAGSVKVPLRSGTPVELPLFKTTLDRWNEPLQKDFFNWGGKPIINCNGVPLFAELALLKQFLASGFEGVWVETFGGPNFLTAMPGAWQVRPWSITIPEDKHDLLRSIWRTARSQACFDLYLWRGPDILFCETKRKGESLTRDQPKFVEGALQSGFKEEQLIVLQWTWGSP